jgi:hypothetical protein
MCEAGSLRGRRFGIGMVAGLACALVGGRARAVDPAEARWTMPGSERQDAADPSYQLVRGGGAETVQPILAHYRNLVAEAVGGGGVAESAGRDRTGRRTITVGCKVEVAGSPVTCATAVTVSTTDEPGRQASQQEQRRASGAVPRREVELVPEPLVMMRQYATDPAAPAPRGGAAPGTRHTTAEWKALAETYGWLYQAFYRKVGDRSEGSRILDRCKQDWGGSASPPGALSEEDLARYGQGQGEERELSDPEAMAFSTRMSREMGQSRAGTGPGPGRDGWDFWLDCLKRMEQAAYRTEIHIQGVFSPR